MSDLPAGRELDALVAEKVMGWVRLTDGHCEDCEAMIAEGSVIMRDPEALVGVVPDYSTSIAAAWEVVEKYGPPYGMFVLRKYAHGGYQAEIYAPSVEHIASANTAPLAICLAALKAVGG